MILPVLFLIATAVPNPATTTSDARTEYFRQAASGSSRAAAIVAAFSLQAGDTGAALQWLPNAAESGDTESQLRLADMYVNGRGVLRDPKRAAHFYALAVNESTEAQWKLGALFQEGDGVPQNQEIAASMYRRAADKGYADAQNSLATMYLTGLGVKQDFKEALKWYRKAAEQECADAQLNLASLYTQGVGVKQDFQAARSWAEKARRIKVHKAEELLAEIEKAQAEANE